jgi:hypothetical protein
MLSAEAWFNLNWRVGQTVPCHPSGYHPISFAGSYPIASWKETFILKLKPSNGLSSWGRRGSTLRHTPPFHSRGRPIKQEKSEMYSVTGRIEERRRIAISVRIISLEHPELVDSGITQNVSSLGLQALFGKRWMPNEPILIESPPGNLRSRGWVVYCRPGSRGQFTVGLRLLTAQPMWSQPFSTKRFVG